MAWYDFRLSLEQFEELTPGQFKELCKRRNLRIKYERFANAQTAAAVYNVNRHSEDTPIVEAFDFVRDEASAIKREERRKAKKFAQKALGNLPPMMSLEKIMEIRGKAIADLKASGRDDAEEIMNEVWPHLKPKE